MKRIILALTMVLALGGSGIAAQSLEEAEGLESFFSREYTTGSSATAAQVSSADSTPQPMESEVEYKRVTVAGLTFESDEAAENYLGEMRSAIEAQTEQSDDEQDAEIQDLDIDNDGFLAVMNVPNTGVNTVVLFVDGNTMFLVDVAHPDRDTANTTATDVAEFVADADIETDEVTFNEDGTSTGGVFDRMPTGDDDVVGDFTTIMDREVFVAGE